jgi:two-component system chemotaxis response regulator CheB
MASTKNNIPFRIIVIGGSAGSFKTTGMLLSDISDPANKCIVLCLHRWKEKTTDFTRSLNIKSRLPVIELFDKATLTPGKVHVVPANYHSYFTKDFKVILTNEEECCFSRPSIDICFSSAAKAFGNTVTGILLSGANNDGAEGLLDIYNAGGKAIIHDPSECEINIMPGEALLLNPHVTILKAEEIKKTL